MIAADTNVLIRIFLDDEEQPKQVSAAINLARTINKIYVAQVVQVEIVWVMERAYQLVRKIRYS